MKIKSERQNGSRSWSITTDPAVDRALALVIWLVALACLGTAAGMSIDRVAVDGLQMLRSLKEFDS